MPEMPNRRACRNVASLVNQIGTVFFNSICVIDHKVPATDIEKISDLCRVTMEDVYAAMAGKALTWLDDSQYALR